MGTINAEILQQVATEWREAARGQQTSVVKRWASIIGISVHTLYRALPDTGRERKGTRILVGIEEAARTVAMLKNRPPEHRGVISTVDALQLCLLNGLIDSRFRDVPASTFDRVIRDLGINTRRRRVERFQAERPNELHHVDASTSSCLYIYKALSDGDFVLKLHRGNKDYKNKPIPVDGLRPWIYGLTDDHSGCHACRYVAAKGENASHNMEFLAWTWWQQAQKCFWGVPDKIKGDHGPMMSSPGAKDFFERLGVKIDHSTPLNKEAHGKIERPWRTLWKSFELPFFALDEWKKFEISLSELNQQLFNYSEKYNDKPHRFERSISRKQAWERISRHGGVVILPPDALETIARSYERTVEQDGCFSLDNMRYEVKGLHDAKVKVIIGVYDKKVIVQDIATGLKYETEAFVPNALGEFKGNKETGQQQVRKEAVELVGVTKMLYATESMEEAKREEKSPVSRVLKMPTRIKETRQLENPLNVDAYPDMQTALREFQGIVGFILDSETRITVARMIRENGFKRRYVASLAAEVMTEQMAAYG